MNSYPGWIAYVGPFSFPYGQAASRRVYGNSKSLLWAGYDVVVVSGDIAPKSCEMVASENGKTLRHIGVNELQPGSCLLKKIWTQLFSWGSRTTSWLSNQPSKPRCVVLYGGLSAYAWNIYRWGKKNNVPVIVDIVEWYDPSQMPGGRMGPFYLSSNFALRVLYPMFDGAIVISQYLANHFAPKIPVLRIPPTVDFPYVQNERLSSDDVLRLVYAGTPGKKDLLDCIIRAVVSVSRHKEIHLSIYGPSAQDLSEICGGDIPSVVSSCGRVSQYEVFEAVRWADFSIFIRESLRFTEAGFPTKFVESLALSTPVITNMTSDIGLYLRDGYNGVIVNTPDEEGVIEALLKASSYSLIEKMNMRKNALDTAHECFSYINFADQLKDFIALFNGGSADAVRGVVK
ncbi:MAG: glycosyltransferase [Pseudomonadota bacterium]